MGELDDQVNVAAEQKEIDKKPKLSLSAEEIDNAKETDKILKIEEKSANSKDNRVEKNNDDGESTTVEDIVKAPATISAKLSVQEREVEPKKIPIGGIKMPGFFTRNKPKAESDGAEGELLENAGNGAKAAESVKVQSRGLLSSLKFKNPFKRQTTNLVDEEKGLTKEETVAAAEKVEDHELPKPAQPPQKKRILGSIRLPLANMIPKRLRSGRHDLESGNGPNTRAGLASMETLDDSQKDNDKGSDVTDKAVNGKHEDELETVKLDNTDDKVPQKADDSLNEKSHSWCERIQAYRCAIDDLAIIGGIILIILLVIIIFTFAFRGTPELKTAPLRDGRFVQAVTSCGYVEGILEDGAFVFRGIPYAAPPIGERRWQPAKLIDNINNCWNGTFKAHNTTQHCMQIQGNGIVDGIEDCLTLDIITPHIRYDNPLPVIVLIGTDTLNGGSPGYLLPSIKISRAQDVVFVRPNYRLGVFGYLAVEALSKTTHPPTSGNYGLSDIIAVLNWIQLNIAHFGGDKKSVTLFGHRSGATIVTALTSAPKVNNLFARSWVSSSGAIFPGKQLHESEKVNQEFVDALGCSDASCLRQKDGNALINSVPDKWRRISWDLPNADENITAPHNWLVLDGEILQKHPANVWSKEMGPIKMVMGTTAHESHSDKLFLKYIEWTPELVRKHIDESVIGRSNLTDEALKLYPPTYQGLVQMISDIRTVCPLLIIARTQPAVPFYIVTQISAAHNISDVNTDVLAILGRYETKTPEQRRYVSAMQQLFYHYVSHGEMKIYEPRRRVLNVGQDAVPQEDYPNCDFWIRNDIVPRYGRIN